MTDTIYHINPTLSSFDGEERWLFYKGKPREHGKVDKKPFSPVTGHPASSTNSETWGTRAEATKRAARFQKAGWKPGIGIVLGDIDGIISLCGVDLDGCLQDGVLEPWAEAILVRLATYAEISQSGNGIKAYFRVEAVELDVLLKASGIKTGKNWSKGDHYGIELHLAAIYFAVTGQEHSSSLMADYLRVVSAEDLLWVIAQAEQFKGEPRGNSGGRASAGKSGRPLGVFRDASLAIPNDELVAYDDWLAIGMALHYEFDGSAEALQLFHEWSAQSGKYDSADLDRRWKSFGREKDRVHTGQYILNLAEANGWRDLERMFGLFTDDMVDVTFGGFLHDEDGAIRAFTQRYTGELLFDHHAGQWSRFNGYWKREETKLALNYARDESVKLARGDAKARGLKRVSSWEAIERGAKSVRDFAVTSEVWNRDKMLLGTPGGTVDLRTGKLRDGLPSDYISRVTAVAPSLDFVPERDCTQWLEFLNEALGSNQAAIRFLQQWSGYSLTGETKEQKFLFVYGPGGSGKGTAINTIGDIMGDYTLNVGMETLTASKNERHTTELARLRGARMVRASETEKGKAWAENRIKTLTGQDTITARFMRQDDFEFRPEFKLTIFGNNRPSLKDVDSAIKRRFLILPFDHQPATRDPELPERLKAEWSGILSWMIEGCLDWQKNGLIVPDVMATAARAYFDAEDTFAQWLADCCELGHQYNDTSDRLWKSWSQYAYRMGEEPGTMKGSFAETLSQRGYPSGQKIGPERKRGYRGLRVRDDAKDPSEKF